MYGYQLLLNVVKKNHTIAIHQNIFVYVGIIKFTTYNRFRR